VIGVHTPEFAFEANADAQGRVRTRAAWRLSHWDTLRSSENYTGYDCTGNFASSGGAEPGKPHRYTAPAELRLNQLIRQPSPVTDHTFGITFLDPGAQACAFTFG
jgi:hypothetical protein